MKLKDNLMITTDESTNFVADFYNIIKFCQVLGQVFINPNVHDGAFRHPLAVLARHTQTNTDFGHLPNRQMARQQLFARYVGKGKRLRVSAF